MTDLRRRKKVLDGEFWKGSETIVSSCQVSVFHTLTVLSSDCMVSAGWIACYDADTRLSSQKVAHWVPCNPFDESLVTCNPVYTLYAR